jgi:hypothetical protein
VVVAFLASVYLRQRYLWLQETRSLGALSARFPSAPDDEKPASHIPS